MILNNKLYDQQLTEASDYIKQQVKNWNEYTTLFVLGSGYNSMVDDFEIIQTLKYSDIPHWPICTAKHHQGNLVFAKYNDKKIIFMQGRHHICEGYTMHEIALPIYTLSLLTINTMFVNNSSGVLESGTFDQLDHIPLQIAKDHINKFGSNPIIGLDNPRLGTRWPASNNLYNEQLRLELIDLAKTNNIILEETIYVGYPGGMFETKTEAKVWGQQATQAGDVRHAMVGMSIIPEVTAAFHTGIKIAAFPTPTLFAIRENDPTGFIIDDFISSRNAKLQEQMTIIFKAWLDK